jgi:hypothetical protein
VNTDFIEIFFGKRFAGLIVVVLCLTLGYFFGRPDMFGAFASTIGLMYGVYVGGQSYTDGKGDGSPPPKGS